MNVSCCDWRSEISPRSGKTLPKRGTWCRRLQKVCAEPCRGCKSGEAPGHHVKKIRKAEKRGFHHAKCGPKAVVDAQQHLVFQAPLVEILPDLQRLVHVARHHHEVAKK